VKINGSMLHWQDWRTIMEIGFCDWWRR